MGTNPASLRERLEVCDGACVEFFGTIGLQAWPSGYILFHARDDGHHRRGKQTTLLQALHCPRLAGWLASFKGDLGLALSSLTPAMSMDAGHVGVISAEPVF